MNKDGQKIKLECISYLSPAPKLYPNTQPINQVELFI
jgi:hypothetical protein